MRKKRIIKNKEGDEMGRKIKGVKSLLLGVIFLALVIGVSSAIYNIKSSINSNHTEKSIQGYVSVDNLGNLEQGIDKGVENLEDIQGKIEGIKETKWDYLGKEWKNMLLKKEIVSKIDTFFKKINFVFIFFFGEDYSLSITLFFIVLLWVYFFAQFSNILKNYSTLSSGVAKIIAVVLAIILSKLKFLRKIVEFIGWLVFSQEGGILRVIIFVAIIFLFIIVSHINSISGKIMKKTREEREKGKEKTNREILNEVVKSLLEGFGENK